MNQIDCNTLSKKETYFLLYERIENYYKDLGCNAFEVLNSQNTKDNIINNILKQCNNDNNKEIEIFLKQHYFKINEDLFNEYKNYNLTEEDANQDEKQKIHINWGYLLEVIITIILFPIFLILGTSLTYHKNDKHRK